MSLGRNQIAALRNLTEIGGKGFAMKCTRPPNGLTGPEYRRVLASLAKRGLARTLDSGRWEMTLGGGSARMNSSRRYYPDYDITEAGRRALAGA